MCFVHTKYPAPVRFYASLYVVVDDIDAGSLHTFSLCSGCGVCSFPMSFHGGFCVLAVLRFIADLDEFVNDEEQMVNHTDNNVVDALEAFADDWSDMAEMGESDTVSVFFGVWCGKSGRGRGSSVQRMCSVFALECSLHVQTFATFVASVPLFHPSSSVASFVVDACCVFLCCVSR